MKKRTAGERAAAKRRKQKSQKILAREAERDVRAGGVDAEQVAEDSALLEHVIGPEPDRDIFDQVARMSGNDTVGRMA